MLRRSCVVVGSAVLASLLSCTPRPAPRVFLGAPGTQETHAQVEVRRGTLTVEVWRLRSEVTVEGHTSTSLLPEAAPSSALELPTTYTIVAPDRQGVLEVMVEALGKEGDVVGRGRGAGELIEHNGINIVIAESFARIFRTNMFNCGLLAIELPKAELDRVFALAGSGADCAVDLERKTLALTGVSGKPISIAFALTPFDEALVRAGGWVEYADQRY